MPIQDVVTVDRLVVIEVVLDPPVGKEIGRIPLSAAQSRDLAIRLMAQADEASIRYGTTEKR